MLILLRLLRFALPLLLGLLIVRFLRSFLASGGASWYRQQTGGGGSGSGAGRARSYGPSRKDPYEALGCSRRDSNEEIKRRYRHLVAKYHPDKFIGQELDPEFVELATRRFQEIQQAWDEIRRQRNIS